MIDVHGMHDMPCCDFGEDKQCFKLCTAKQQTLVLINVSVENWVTSLDVIATTKQCVRSPVSGSLSDF